MKESMDITVNNLSLNNSQELANEAVKLLCEKLGSEIKLYDVRDTEAITDFYVVATGRSLSHVSSLADDLCERIRLRGRDFERVEGKRGNPWILVDYIDVIIHIFDKHSRDFYNFDRLMPEGSLMDISDLLADVDKKFEQ